MKVNIFVSCLVVFLTWSVSAHQWTHASDTQTFYLYAPGIFASERQAAYYCTAYPASTGEVVVCGKHIETIQGDYCSGCNFAEIVLSPSDKKDQHPSATGGTLMSRILTKGRGWFHNRIHDKKMDIAIEGESINGTTVQNHQVHVPCVSLAQHQDIDILSTSYDDCIQKISGPLVVYGVSRGAETAFNFLATAYNDKEKQFVRAAVLEGCFDSLEHVFKEYFFLKRCFFRLLAHRYFSIAVADRVEPIDLVTSFPFDIPVLFITSEEDEVVSSACTKELCNALKSEGHEQVYLLELAHSSHNGYFWEDALDSWKYERIVHAFYKRCGLDYISDYASAGEALLDHCKL